MRGILITLESIISLFEKLQQEFGLEFLKGQNTNQDYLEAYFGEIRGMNGSCTHPTALQFLYTLGRKIGSELASVPSFDLLGKRLELEKSLEVEPMPDKDCEEIENMLVDHNPSEMSEAEQDGFYKIAASVCQKFHLAHPDLGKAKDSSSSSSSMQFANSFSKGQFIVQIRNRFIFFNLLFSVIIVNTMHIFPFKQNHG